MLRLRGDDRFDLEEARRAHQRRIRQQELKAMFKTIRSSLLQAELKQPQPLPIPIQQPLYNYQQYLSYLLQMPQLQPLFRPSPLIHHQPLALPMPSPLPVLSVRNSPERNVYFTKNGITVFKSQLGRGTYSRVWEGRIVATGETVAVKEVKTLQPSEEKCLRQLRSEHIIRVIDIFPYVGKSFIVLQLCQCNLREQLDKHKFEIQIVLSYFQQLVEGMGVLQRANIIHRDLKFENILVRQGSLKIADFGLAKFLGDELQVESRRCGTPYTMAPEIFFCIERKAPYTVKSDLWAIGVILHQMLYQEHPFKCSTSQFKKQLRVPISRRFGILDTIIDRCLIFEPELRVSWPEFRQLFSQYLRQKMKVPINEVEKQQQQYQIVKPMERAFAKKKANFYQEQQHQPIRIAKQYRKRQIKVNQEKERTPDRRSKYGFEEAAERQPVINRYIQNRRRRPSPFQLNPNIVKKEPIQSDIVTKKEETNHQAPLRAFGEDGLRQINNHQSKNSGKLAGALIGIIVIMIALMPLF